MPDPVLHVIAGPNGSGKTTFFELALFPVTRLRFVNADAIAAERWPESASARAYDAARLAAEDRDELIAGRVSFATETVFSHPSKLELLATASDAGYLITLHVLMVPEALALARVRERVRLGGHEVPEEKVRARYGRLWAFVTGAIETVEDAHVYDNSLAATPFRPVASFREGHLVGDPPWPAWTPDDLRTAGR